MDVNEWLAGAADGSLGEAFACGTATAVTPIGRLCRPGGETVIGGGQSRAVTMKLRQSLQDIQYGRAQDRLGWLRQV